MASGQEQPPDSGENGPLFDLDTSIMTKGGKLPATWGKNFLGMAGERVGESAGLGEPGGRGSGGGGALQTR